MSTIVIVFLDIFDRVEYETYMKAAGPIFIREGVKLLVNDENPKPMSDGMEMDKVVVLEFRDDDHMKQFFRLPDYLQAGVHRDKGAHMRLVRTTRFEMPT
ncbi:MAG: DUF1330 domain-containing protein [Pseudomonadota bacterium]